VFAEGVRALVRPGAPAGAVLRPGVAGGGRAVAALEGAAALSPDRSRPGLSLRAESPAPRAPAIWVA